MEDFAAIDFETANGARTSVCSVGVVVVRQGEITQRFYSLIQPEPNYYSWFCQRVHGLDHSDTDGAPLFPDVWARIAPLVEGLPLVAHNAPFDSGCLKAVMRCYQMDDPGYVRPTISCRPLPPCAATTSPAIITLSPTRRPAPISP